MHETTVLSTKLYRPRLVRDLVERPRLFDTLNKRIQRRRLTLVCAPPGYGKTTLVAHWLSTLDGPTVWVTLDELNNDLSSSASYLTAAITAVYPDSCHLSAALLISPQPMLPAVMADALIEDLANLPGTLVIALDDFYTVHDIAVHECVERVVQYMPTNCHLVIASRETPPWSLGRLRLSGELVEIGVDDLRFTTAEAHQFLEGLLRKPLNDAAIESLERLTEGWAAGLQMAAIGLSDIDNPEPGLWQDRLLVTEYLLDEVLAKQETTVRDFLLRTSILGRLCDPLARVTLGPPAAGGEGEGGASWPTMGRLMRANLFLTPLDSQHAWFRYHPLFRELLQRRLAEQVPGEEVAAMHRRASAWLAAQGMVEEALHHAAAAGDEAAMVSIVAAHMHGALNLERWQLLANWLELIPESLRNSHPLLLVAKAYSLNLQLRYKAVMVVVNEAETQLTAQGETLPPDERHTTQAQIDLLKAACFFWAGDGERAIAAAESALRGLGPDMLYARSMGEFYRAISHNTVGRRATGLAYLQQALDSQTQRIDTFSARLHLAQASIHLNHGHFQQFQHASDALGRVGRRAGLPVTTGWHHYTAALLAYEWNDLPQAEQQLRQVTQSPYQVNGRTAFESFIGLALTLEALGQPAAADEEVRRLNEFLVESGYQGALVLVESVNLWLETSRGTPPALSPIGESIAPAAAVDDVQLSYWLTPLLVRARAMISRGLANAGGDAREVRTILAACRAAAESVNLQRYVTRILALEALLAAACGDEPAALDALKQSLRLAEPGRLVRTYVDCGPRLIPLLELLRDEFPASGYVERLLGAFASSSAAGARSAAAAPSVAPYLQLSASLTNREMEVLQLLADRLSNKEIATQMFIAPETVKRYNLRIFQKLGVNNRRAAVSLARHLDLIPA